MTEAATPHVNIQEAIQRSNAYACLQCGKCTSVCPVSIEGRSYSPRMTVTRTAREDLNGLLEASDLWSCLTCQKCDAYCPAGVSYLSLMKVLRVGAKEAGFDGTCSHSGALQTLARLMVNPNLKQERLDWLPADAKTAQKGDVLYFVGCAPYFDALFTNLELRTLDAAISSIRILNSMGIEPVLMDDERCCGHDLFWNGDRANFQRLAEHNVAAIKATGAKTILFSCAECQSAFKQLYAEAGLAVSAELKHMSEFLAEKMQTGELELDEPSMDVTYQDPCRLGRHLGIYDAPRQVLSGDGHLKEMIQHEQRSLCCGVSGWMNCGATAKGIQVQRLRQARDTGAKVMAVACPKCQVHLLCAQQDRGIGAENAIEIRDIATLALARLKDRKAAGKVKKVLSTK
ncbi:MAG: (Fe-S)-binding protein [Candidatus Neomarinimicrobiota bacterium]